MIVINFNKFSKSLVASIVILTGCIIFSGNAFAQTEEKIESQGFTSQEIELKKFIEEKANDKGESYNQVANEIFEKVKTIHKKYSDKPLYNDLTNDKSLDTLGAKSSESIALSSVTSSRRLEREVESVVSGLLSIEYGVDTLVYNSGSFREYIEVYENSAFVIPYGTGVHDWSPAYELAEKTSPTEITFRAYGNIESEVSHSVSGGFELAGFQIGVSTGTTVTLRKNHQINHVFSLY